LQLDEIDSKEVTLAMDRRDWFLTSALSNYVLRTGWVLQARWLWAIKFCWGRLPMEDMDLVIIPRTRTLM
jgi:hypothetical protein